MINESEKFVLLGSSGILGTGFEAKLKEKNVTKTPRLEVETWLGETGYSSMRKYLAKLEPNTTVINAIGLTDPKTTFDQMNRLNFVLPKQLLSIINELELNLITFGTILEKNIFLTEGNNYMKIKNDFFNYIQESPPSKSHLHIQLHTIYGGERSHKHMLIDQIFNALAHKNQFEMSSGLQVREYHHIEDEMNAISKILESTQFGVVELNAGNAIQIKQLATEIFSEFGELSLLKFNPERDVAEVFNHFYEKSSLLAEIHFRDSISGVIDYLKKRLEVHR